MNNKLPQPTQINRAEKLRGDIIFFIIGFFIIHLFISFLDFLFKPLKAISPKEAADKVDAKIEEKKTNRLLRRTAGNHPNDPMEQFYLRFVEKPNVETANRYLADGNYYWNSGIFIWQTSIILECFKKLMIDHYKAFEPLRSLEPEQFLSNEGEIWSIKEEIFSLIESISIDYGIMEKADNRVVIPSDFGWGDLGSWKSIDEILLHDANMNRTPNEKSVLFLDSENCLVFTENKRVTVLGLSDVVVVESGDDLLVMNKGSSQDVRRVVDIINKKGLPD